jgi:hypothetical protein
LKAAEDWRALSHSCSLEVPELEEHYLIALTPDKAQQRKWISKSCRLGVARNCRAED